MADTVDTDTAETAEIWTRETWHKTEPLHLRHAVFNTMSDQTWNPITLHAASMDTEYDEWVDRLDRWMGGQMDGRAGGWAGAAADPLISMCKVLLCLRRSA